MAASSSHAARGLAHALVQWATGWWRIVHLGGVMLVLGLSPSSYRGERRKAMARHVVLGCAPLLPWFVVLSTLISLVIVRVVVVTAVSYGLSRYALGMVVRVLVLELIPLTTALFVAVRCTLPLAAEVAVLQQRGRIELRADVLPRAVAGLFCMFMLAALSGVIALVLSYLSVYGFTPWGFEAYTRTVGQLFGPVVTLVFLLKVLLMGLAVALIPIGSVLYDLPSARSRTSAELRGLVRLFLVILLIEVSALVGNYA